jgi:hypothetical protein
MKGDVGEPSARRGGSHRARAMDGRGEGHFRGHWHDSVAAEDEDSRWGDLDG